MRRVALKGLWYRRVRALLTGFAVVLGVAMVSGTYILTDTVSKAFDTIFNSSYSTSSVVITGREVVSGAMSGNATLPASLVSRVQGADGVQAAAGAIFQLNGQSDQAKLVGSDGKAITAQGPTFAFGFRPSAARFNPLSLTAGHWASGPDEVVVDKATAKDHHWTVGQRIGVAARGPVRKFRISGIARFGTIDSLGGATIAIFDLPTAQALLAKRGQVDTIFVAAKPGVSASALVQKLDPLVPNTAEVRSASDQAKADSKDTREGTKFIRYFLLAFGLIALGVGAFVIFNTLSITVAQRVRELATLRTLGASQRQVMRSVLLEGTAIGVLASITGLFAGLGLAKGLEALFDALGAGIPKTGLVFELRTVIVALALGTVVTVVASVSPARRATRIAPVAAVREGATLPPRLGARRPAVPLTILGVALVMLLVASFGGGPALRILLLELGGCVLLFVGVGMVAARAVRPIASVVGGPARRFGGVAGRLAVRNATRNTTRTASTAAALMIGLALVTLVASLGGSLRDSDRNALRNQVRSNYVVSSKNGFEAFPTQAAAALAQVPGTRVVAVRREDAKVLGETLPVDGIGPGAPGLVDVHWSDGSNAVLSRLGGAGAAVESGFAKDNHLVVGSTFPLKTSTGQTVPFRVAGIFKRTDVEKLDPVLAKILISERAFDATFPRPQANLAFVQTSGTDSATTARLKAALAPYPSAEIRTREDWVKARSKGIEQLLNLLYILLALSVIVSLFGMVNTLVLSVFERTREIGMLRAVGMSRRQVRRMVRHEGVVTALIGAALGLPLGLFLAVLITRALHSLGVSFVIPVSSLIVFTVVAVIAGVIASVLPARRAARLDVLGALQYE